jgi:hypothetical protein
MIIITCFCSYEDYHVLNQETISVRLSPFLLFAYPVYHKYILKAAQRHVSLLILCPFCQHKDYDRNLQMYVYSEHGGLRIEYSIFLLAAGASQIAYSMLYVLLTIAGESAEESKSRSFAKSYYRKSMAVNLFGLVGSAILLGLYTYSVILPPPLSPNNVPEDVDLGGILDKTLEAALVIGVVYLMRAEKKNLQNQFLEVK